jgi:alpha-galactosidase
MTESTERGGVRPVVAEDLVHLRAAGRSLLLDAGRGPARVVHWGPDLGDLSGDAAAELAKVTANYPRADGGTWRPPTLHLLPERATAYHGRPGLSGHRMGYDWTPSFETVELDSPAPDRVVVTAVDSAASLRLRTELELPPSGLLRVRHAVKNEGDAPYVLDGLLAVLPLPVRATDLLDFTGRWCRERHPQRHTLPFGTWTRESRQGRTGHDAPIGLIAGTSGFGLRHGQLWAIHVAWSGDHTMFAERHRSGVAAIGGGELLNPGEVILERGEEYTSPWLVAAYSADGVDGMTEVFHEWMRSRPHHPGPDRPRPVVLNTWEAVYFDHDLDRLKALADTGARVGAERFVLDDGWFRRRRDDTAGLGDWYVDESVWPNGLGPLIEHVRGLGLEFGLWVEPEMVNPDSDLYRAHPDWILSANGRLPPEERNQHVLDFANPDAYAYILERLDALLSEYDIAYVKWDHNRDLVEPGHAGRPGVHAHTLAVYRLLDELRSRHPGVEIESCASGGARVDLGILERTDRVWTSDCNDALERQVIQRWTSAFLPPELVGAHVGPPRSHTTGRVQDLSFRAATALFGHFGVEWDISRASREEQDELAEWIALYKRLRPLLHNGTVVRADHPVESEWLHGVVSKDRTQAVYAFAQMTSSAAERPGPIPLPGLNPDTVYRVTPAAASRPRLLNQYGQPNWFAEGGATLPGRVLAEVGLPMPALLPEQAVVLQCEQAEGRPRR